MESYLYVADSRHAPYGERTQEFLHARATEVVDFLLRQQVKALVLACNTVSVTAAASLREAHDLPIVAMEPAIKPAALATRSGTVLVLATANTIRSQAVERLCGRFGRLARIILQPCPGLAEQVEGGQIDSARTRDLLNAYLRPGIDAGADAVVLGCTHYAFLRATISDLVGQHVAIIEPSEAIARQLHARLSAINSLSRDVARPTMFFTSGHVNHLCSFLHMIGESPQFIRTIAS